MENEYVKRIDPTLTLPKEGLNFDQLERSGLFSCWVNARSASQAIKGNDRYSIYSNGSNKASASFVPRTMVSSNYSPKARA